MTYGTDAYEQGYQAYVNEDSKTGNGTNPYPLFTCAWADWNEGWTRAYLDSHDSQC
jgi:hypothetical protein